MPAPRPSGRLPKRCTMGFDPATMPPVLQLQWRSAHTSRISANWTPHSSAGRPFVEDAATALREAGDVILVIAKGALTATDAVTMCDVVTSGFPPPAGRPGFQGRHYGVGRFRSRGSSRAPRVPEARAASFAIQRSFGRHHWLHSDGMAIPRCAAIRSRS